MRTRLYQPFAAIAVVLLVASAVACGSRGASRDVRACVERWNGSIAKRHELVDLVYGTEANVRIADGRCIVTLMGPRRRAFTFDSGHPQGIGGVLFPGLVPPEGMPRGPPRARA